MIAIELTHPTDPRWLLADYAPARVTLDDLANWTFGKPMIVKPDGLDVVAYPQPDGPGTDWIRP